MWFIMLVKYQKRKSRKWDVLIVIIIFFFLLLFALSFITSPLQAEKKKFSDPDIRKYNEKEKKK